jgi:hypothetical protein
VRHKVFGYHGTTQEVAKIILEDVRQFKHSTSPGDWLGSGIYFFENSYLKGLEWARRTVSKRNMSGHRDVTAVIACEIDLSRCLDLCDPTFAEELRSWVDENIAIDGLEMQHAPRLFSIGKREFSISDRPYNHARNRDRYQHPYKVNVLDKEVINAFLEAMPTAKRFSTVRAPFNSGRQLFPNSYLFHNSQVQIAVRDPERAMAKLQIVDGPLGRRKGTA